MNWVEKMAPTVPITQATMVGAPMRPVTVKYSGGSGPVWTAPV